MQKQERIEWIDIAKGIGILLVIMGHTFQLGMVTPLYAFHMPLFFFLSGLLINREKMGDFGKFTWKKMYQLLKPWLIVMCICFGVCLCIPEWYMNLTIPNLLGDLYTANTNTIQNSSIWYLPCYFWALMIFYLFNKMYNGSIMSKIIFVVYAFTLLFFQEILSLFPLPYGRLPLKLDSALLAVVFIGLAVWNRDYIFVVVRKYNGFKKCLFVTLIAAIVCFANGWANMNSLDFGRIRLLYYPIALIGILSVCLVSSFISFNKYVKIRKILSFYGKNSMVIFVFQSLYIRLYILTFNHLFNLNMTLYGNNPFYHQIGSFLFVAFVMSPLTVLLFQSLKKKGIKIF